jgi:hypothetical protein
MVLAISECSFNKLDKSESEYGRFSAKLQGWLVLRGGPSATFSNDRNLAAQTEYCPVPDRSNGVMLET